MNPFELVLYLAYDAHFGGRENLAPAVRKLKHDPEKTTLGLDKDAKLKFGDRVKIVVE